MRGHDPRRQVEGLDPVTPLTDRDLEVLQRVAWPIEAEQRLRLREACRQVVGMRREHDLVRRMGVFDPTDLGQRSRLDHQQRRQLTHPRVGGAQAHRADEQVRSLGGVAATP